MPVATGATKASFADLKKKEEKEKINGDGNVEENEFIPDTGKYKLTTQ